MFSFCLLEPPAAEAQLQLVPYVTGLNAPVGFVQDPADPSVQYVIEQGGRIRVIQSGALLPTPFLDVSSLISCCVEQGLLGLAFPPDYASSRRFFVNYTNAAGNTVVARYLRSASNRLVADPSSWFPLRWLGASTVIIQPFANHNGGHLAFGPDGYLYIGMGDGGGAVNDAQNNSQNPLSLLGKMLRIDVNVPLDHPDGYLIPPDNPWAFSSAVLREIWAFGLRNPWKFSFDPPSRGGSGALYIGDVGQSKWEEIDYVPPGFGGKNFGWRIYEGREANPGPFVPSDLHAPTLFFDEPLNEYPNPPGAAVIGGVVYHGSAMRSVYRGRYFYGDLYGRVWSLVAEPFEGTAILRSSVEHTDELGGPDKAAVLTAFGTDASGEIYLVNYSRGTILKLVDPAPAGPTPVADFNGDRMPDLIGVRDGAVSAWNMGGGAFGEQMLDRSYLGFLPGGWSVVGTADADGDGHTDLFLQSDGGLLGIWFFDGPVFRYGIALNPSAVSDAAWRVRAVADFNHDGHPDLVWQHRATGQIAFWLLNGVNVIGYRIPPVGVPGPDWQVFGTGDSNQDGERDLFWQRQSDGLLAVWRMRGTDYNGGLLLSASPADPSWHAVGTSDLDRDGSVDVLFQYGSTHELAAWYLNGETVRFGTFLTPRSSDPYTIIVGPR